MSNSSFKNVNVADNLTVDGVVRAERLNVTSSENILATFISTDAAAKIVLKDVDGEGARLSYIGSSDTVGLGQSNTHNQMAIHIDNNERVAIGSNHTIPNAVLDVSGSFNVSGSLISRVVGIFYKYLILYYINIYVLTILLVKHIILRLTSTRRNNEKQTTVNYRCDCCHSRSCFLHGWRRQICKKIRQRQC